MPRPLLNRTTQELEEEFERRQDDAPFLKILHHELSFRSRPRALSLRSRVGVRADDICQDPEFQRAYQVHFENVAVAIAVGTAPGEV